MSHNNKAKAGDAFMFPKAGICAISVVLATLVFCSRAEARAGNPTEDDEDGLVWAGAVTYSSIRGMALSDRSSLIAGLGYAKRGWSISAATSKAAGSGSAVAYEGLVSYGYKLPLVDAHIGAVTCNTQSNLARCGTGVRFGLSTNNSTRNEAHMALDRGGSGEIILSVGFGSRLHRHNNLAIDGKVEHTHSNWRSVSSSTTIWSVVLRDAEVGRNSPTLAAGYYRRSSNRIEERNASVFIGVTFALNVR